MSSQCYWCIAGKPAYGSLLGTMGDPFACCYKCNIFCCGHHGQRDHGAQKFFCFDCDKTILIASAVKLAKLEPGTINQIASRSERFHPADVLLDFLFRSIEEFLRRKPGYGNYFEGLDESYIDYNNWPDIFLSNTLRQFPAAAQKLLVAAAYIIADTDTDAELANDPLFLGLKTSLKVPVHG